MVRMVAGLTAALLLSGCVTSSPPPAGLSDGDRFDFALQEQELQWLLADLPGERPLVSPMLVSEDRYGSLLNDCLEDRGLGQVMVFAGGVLSLPQAPLTPEQRLSLYLCSARYVLSPDESGYLSTEERERVYDYYSDWLVPCIGAHGYPVPLSQSRGEFAATPGFLDWNPYWALENRVPSESLSALEERCPMMPPGIF